MVYLYYGLMCLCFLATLLFHRKESVVKLIRLLLILSIITEAVVESVGKSWKSFYFLYHIFTLAEYTLITLILARQVQSARLRQWMIRSIYILLPLFIYISVAAQGVNEFPSINSNIEGCAIIVWCIFSFFSIEPMGERSIFQCPEFWITLAFFLYFSGTIAFNGVYNTLREADAAKAKYLFTWINSIFNYLLYILLMVGIFSYKWKSNSLQQSLQSR